MDYTWVYLSLIAAFSLATSDALTKKSVEHNNVYLIALSRLIFTMPLLAVLWFFIPKPALDMEFYKAFSMAVPIELLTVILYVKALKASPLSLTLPFMSLTPVILILVSYLILGEKVSLLGGAGIFSIAAGSYLLNIGEIRKGLLGPFRAITKEKGSVLMICVALCYSFTASLGKMAIEHSSPLFFGITYFAVLSVFFTPLGLWMGRADLRSFVSEGKFRSMVPAGVFYSVMIVAHMSAMKLTKVAYMISVKRISLLIGVLYGYFIFKEEGIKERLLGALLMFFGFVMVVSSR